MSPVHLGAAGSSPTIFTVLARTARSHSRRYLTAESLMALAVAMGVIALEPQWWPLASLAAAVSLYAAWGLIAREGDRGATRRRVWFRVYVAALATTAAVLGIGGLGVKVFTGTAPGPYGACYQPDGRAYPCHSDGSPRPVSHR